MQSAGAPALHAGRSGPKMTALAGSSQSASAAIGVSVVLRNTTRRLVRVVPIRRKSPVAGAVTPVGVRIIGRSPRMEKLLTALQSSGQTQRAETLPKTSLARGMAV